MRWFPYRESHDDGQTWVWREPINFDPHYPNDYSYQRYPTSRGAVTVHFTWDGTSAIGFEEGIVDDPEQMSFAGPSAYWSQIERTSGLGTDWHHLRQVLHDHAQLPPAETDTLVALARDQHAAWLRTSELEYSESRARVREVARNLIVVFVALAVTLWFAKNRRAGWTNDSARHFRLRYEKATTDVANGWRNHWRTRRGSSSKT